MHIHLPGDEITQPVFIANIVHQIAQQHNDTLAAGTQAEMPQRLPQIATAHWGGLIEEIEQPAETAAPPERGRDARWPLAERLDDNAVLTDETDKTERRGNLLGEMQFR